MSRLVPCFLGLALALTACGAAETNPEDTAQPDASGEASSSETSGESSSSGSTSTGDPPAPCAEDAYPAGPYGNVAGTYLPADLVLEGLLEGQEARADVRLGDLRDCDGRSGVNALYFIGAMTSCSVCNREAPQLDEDLPALRELGIRVVILMMDGQVEPWREEYGLDGAAVLSDVDETFFVDGANAFSDNPNGTPLNVIVDPRTGLIVDRDLGGYDRASLYALAEKNRGD